MPFLTPEQKQDRFDWCVGNLNNEFYNFVFVDETSVWVNQMPLYHMRQSGTSPEGLVSASNARYKLHVWGGISLRGPTSFFVRQFL